MGLRRTNARVEGKIGFDLCDITLCDFFRNTAVAEIEEYLYGNNYRGSGCIYIIGGRQVG
jgi:hypothetical protein